MGSGLLDSILTDGELCKLLRIDKGTTFHWREHAGLPYFRLGVRGKRGSVRYHRAEVERWLEARRGVVASRKKRALKTAVAATSR